MKKLIKKIYIGLAATAIVTCLNTNAGFAQAQPSGSSVHWMNHNSRIVIRANSDGSNHDEGIQFAAGGGSGSSLPYRQIMRLRYNGNVGIGTDNPGERLHVEGRMRIGGSNAGLWVEAGTHDWFMGRNSSTGSSLRFYNNGDKMILSADGRLSLGISSATTSNSSAKLTVKSGDIHLEGGAFSSHGTLNFRPDTDNSGDDAIVFKNNAEAETMRIHTNDNVGIGTNNPQAKLHVNGTAKLAGTLTGTSANFSSNLTGTTANFSSNVQANSLTLNVGSFPDYVFAKSYDLMPLEQVEAYIKTNHHLPKVPKAAKVEKEGMNVAQINVLLMEKVEELTLHTITQHKQIKGLQQQNQELLKRLERLEKLLQKN
ncbi:hypothetical protein [uncultured Microscilla sp.]|uniref:hypothetical protein n=1 Tax=uncultured Microscilla sp. TaxID=432653 RepID=UPI002608530A|nr:hypothetical protein [uncultured Microscilla sp.]